MAEADSSVMQPAPQLSLDFPRVTLPTRAREARVLPAAGLFAGVGGIELGLASAGHETTLLCEIDEIARSVLDSRFPDVRKHSDVCTLKSLPRETKLLVGGFPCQDLSQAGMTRGIDGMRSGLVREAFRLLQRRRVPWLVLENVSFMLSLGGGRALHVILDALEELGYRWAYRVVDSRAFGLPQRRERIFIVASTEDDPRAVLFADEAGIPPEKRRDDGFAAGFYWTEGLRGLGWAVDAVPTLKGGSTVGVPSPPGIWMPDGRIVTPTIQDAERMQGFPRNWTKAAEGVAKPGYRWKLVGNAVSVPVIKWLGKRLARPGDVQLDGVRRLDGGGRWPDAAFNVGDGRFANALSRYPKAVSGKPLHEFIDDDPPPLSRRATAGFLERASRSTLRFPPGFLDAMRAHLARMEALERSGDG
jgi:DNA (cytosine-5)-methyltransferase 1